jgi:hypothetical protein
MTKLEIFNKVKTHLLSQNRRALAQNGECKYRTNEGLKCAVGCLIVDYAYNPELEGYGALDDCIRVAVSESIGRKLTKIEALMLCDLQDIHDNHEPDEWKTIIDRFEKHI